MVSFLLSGNVVGVITDRASVTRPSQIELVNPDRVTVQVSPDGNVWRLDGGEIDCADCSASQQVCVCARAAGGS